MTKKFTMILCHGYVVSLGLLYKTEIAILLESSRMRSHAPITCALELVSLELRANFIILNRILPFLLMGLLITDLLIHLVILWRWTSCMVIPQNNILVCSSFRRSTDLLASYLSSLSRDVICTRMEHFYG